MNLKRASLVAVAACMLPGIAVAQTADITFNVQKVFPDGNEAPVTVEISCNSGSNTQPPVEITDDGVGHTFVMTDLVSNPEGNTCTITETGAPAGYTASYEANGTAVTSCTYVQGLIRQETAPGNGEEPVLEDSVAMLLDGNTCVITNTLDYVELDVSKVWEYTDSNISDVADVAKIRIRSEDEMWRQRNNGKFTEANRCGGQNQFWCVTYSYEGDETKTVRVFPDFEGTTVTMTERDFASAVEVSNDCGSGVSGSVELFPGVDDDCEFTNTVFFEGIPTLSQYGMAIMALLMLGVGFVGFRRFV